MYLNILLNKVEKRESHSLSLSLNYAASADFDAFFNLANSLYRCKLMN